ncbi:MAG: hypothetical protein ACO23F_03590 [Candidatus Limnocylindrus sp.]
MLPPPDSAQRSSSRMPFRHVASTILLATSFILAAGALVTWGMDQQIGPWAPDGVVVVTEEPSSSPSGGSSPSPAAEPSDPAERSRTTPPPLPPVDPSLLVPSVAGDPVRVLVSGVWINLPVVRPPLEGDGTPRFPWCRVAEWMPTKGKADGKTGILFIYAHGRYWEFGGLLDKTPKQMLGQIIEVDVLPKVTGTTLFRLRYRVTEVRQHISTWADIADVPNGRVVLQTSETDRHDGTKLVVIGKYIDTTTSTRPVPVAKPQICE